MVSKKEKAEQEVLQINIKNSLLQFPQKMWEQAIWVKKRKKSKGGKSKQCVWKAKENKKAEKIKQSLRELETEKTKR